MSAAPLPVPAVDPLQPPLLDAQGRRMTYLRLSVTDRCNFRCAYCSPAHWGGKKDTLGPAEFERIVSVFAAMGIRRVRLTGGEPTIRPDITEIGTRLSSVPGIERVAITTNASRLKPLARPLVDAGISQLNLSLDTLSAETFRRISPMGRFEDVLEGIDAAAEAGFESLKLNVVVVKGMNDGEVPELVRYAHARGITPRFIELMPFGQGEPVPTKELVQRLEAEGFDMVPDDAVPSQLSGPARYYRTAGGHVGFISPMTQNFCGGCNRVRVASNGDLRSCLGGRAQAPLHTLIRGGATDAELALAIRAALGEKPEGHRFADADAKDKLLSMMGIGG
jgi:cyclic pyranopterin phosphate synthase